MLAAPSLGLDPASQADVKAVTDHISVSVPSNTTFLDISCTLPSREAARACAGAFATAYVEDRKATAQAAYDAARRLPLAQIAAQTRRINALNADLATTSSESVRLSIQNHIDLISAARELAIAQLGTIPQPSPSSAVVALPATFPIDPSNKDFVLTGMLAMILGLALGIGAAFVRERLDERVDNRETLEGALDAPVFAVVPRVASWRNKKETQVVTISAPDSPPSEAYKTIRTTILYLAGQSGLKVIAVTGPGLGEGKTTTTVISRCPSPRPANGSWRYRATCGSRVSTDSSGTATTSACPASSPEEPI